MDDWGKEVKAPNTLHIRSSLVPRLWGKGTRLHSFQVHNYLHWLKYAIGMDWYLPFSFLAWGITDRVWMYQSAATFYLTDYNVRSVVAPIQSLAFPLLHWVFTSILCNGLQPEVGRVWPFCAANYAGSFTNKALNGLELLVTLRIKAEKSHIT